MLKIYTNFYIRRKLHYSPSCASLPEWKPRYLQWLARLSSGTLLPPFTPLTWPPRLPLLHCSLCSSRTGIRVFGMNVQVVSCLRTFALTFPSFRRLLPPEYSPNQLPHFFQICRNHPFSRPSLATLCKISDTPPWQITASSLHYFFSFALITITYSIIYILSHLLYSSITKQ